MKFQVYRHSDKWHWWLCGEHGEVIARSQGGYNEQGDCLAAVSKVQGTTIETPVQVLEKKLP